MDDDSIRQRIHAVIPGGAHTYSRGDDQFPQNTPAVLLKGKGCYVWGSDGRKYLDYGMGLRSVTIGYARKEIDDCAIAEIKKGTSLTKATLTELDAAEKLIPLFPGMEMVKFAKNGSVQTTAAVKLARAFTGRKYIAKCSSQPFFSYDDWFIGSTVVSRGVPKEISGLTLGFEFNSIDSLKKVFSEHKGEIACVIMEPTTHIPPKGGFLNEVQELAHENGALFILDEISCAFRVDYAVYKRFGVLPDLVTTGKGIANGYAVAALLGKREIMGLGGIDGSAERVFLTSTTFGAEMPALGAMMATIDFFREHDVLGHLHAYQEKLISGINSISSEFGIRDYFYLEGYPGRINYVTNDASRNGSYEFRTLFSQEMAERGIILPWISPSYAHGEKELEMTIDAARESLTIYKKALQGRVGDYVRGKTIKPVFRRFN